LQKIRRNVALGPAHDACPSSSDSPDSRTDPAFNGRRVPFNWVAPNAIKQHEGIGFDSPRDHLGWVGLVWFGLTRFDAIRCGAFRCGFWVPWAAGHLSTCRECLFI